MKTPLLGLCAAAVLLLAGCDTRSISNSEFDANYRYGRTGSYAGELSEFDVLGVEAGRQTSDADIAAALRNRVSTPLRPDSRILLIQSGADFPDAAMLDGLSAGYTVAPFSGKPPERKQTEVSYAKTLRLAAARGGYDKIICYWGVLESRRENKVTKTISWVPLAGYVITDERETMRIRLKAVVIDTATGQWTIVQPPALDSKQYSSILTRKDTDQDLVAQLKAAGYASLVSLLRATGQG